MTTFKLEVFFSRPMILMPHPKTNIPMQGVWTSPERLEKLVIQKILIQSFGPSSQIMKEWNDFLHFGDSVIQEQLQVRFETISHPSSHWLGQYFRNHRTQQKLQTFYNLLQKRYPMTGRFVALTRESDKKAFYLPYFGSTLPALRLKRAYAS